MTTGTPFPNAAPDTAEKTAAPERDLSRMLAGLRPELRPGRYAFTIVSGPGALPAGIDPVVTVAEPEGSGGVRRILAGAVTPGTAPGCVAEMPE
ncbi:ACT domain-containing protein [Streptomyces sp. NPDC048717]|uniref:ACT domain-containing protein n=1 Tax=Streptomyces sp. NPDC048717 TaxID=3154928 RepID=UPI00342B1013